LEATRRCSGILFKRGLAFGLLFLAILLGINLKAEEYVVVSDLPSDFNNIVLDIVQKELLQDRIVLPFSIEDQENCLINENCLEEVNSLYPQAILLKLNLIDADLNKEVFITLLDLKNKKVLNSKYIDCFNCSRLDIIAEIKNINVFIKDEKDIGSYSLIRNPHNFSYPSKVLDAKLESVSLTTTPPSEVFINGMSIGQTPLQISGSRDKKVNVSFINIHHKRLIKSLSFRKSADLKFDLIPIVASLSLSSSPSKANLYVNGKRMGKTPKVIQKIKLTDTLDIRLELENHLVERLTYSPNREGKEKLNVNLTKGQGFLRVKHDSDSSKINVFINNDKTSTTLNDYNNGTIVLDAGRNNIMLQKGDVTRKESFDIKIDEYMDWEVAFVDSVDISISF